MTVFKVGMEYKMNAGMTLRGGFSHGNNPIKGSEILFNILAPGVIENHIALGFSKNMGSGGNQIHFSFNYALNSKVEGDNLFDFDPATSDLANGMFVRNQQISIEMNQIDIGYTF